MSLNECKIESYKTGVSSLPDYPSDAEYTAAELKAVFDARSDGEIREKHNALVDEITARTEETAQEIAEAEANAKAYADSAISAAISAISNGDEVSY